MELMMSHLLRKTESDNCCFSVIKLLVGIKLIVWFS